MLLLAVYAWISLFPVLHTCMLQNGGFSVCRVWAAGSTLSVFVRLLLLRLISVLTTKNCSFRA